ncbi:hypothetical protein [Duganella vulcania]|uniref:Uncharacterized protein n=1 Tax=Duganella vulcania TaxID=2692166 RepID=A0A845GF73_9BURK|nr:hypothetical protein [Duganella vulcania]MYM92581.1 hypothetical protein [Duganella vulcania]
MTYASITVTKDGEQKFHATSGRMGFAESAALDFLCWASPIIGAAYTVVDDAARRITAMGAEVTLVAADVAQP